ncbi:MAG: hypothetical protein ACI4PP_04375 [Clostridia bacterium]
MAGFQNFGKLPDLSGSTIEESLKKVQDYLFLLQEQLTFLFRNIGVENINEQAVSEMKTLFTEEIEGKISDDEEHLAELQLTAEHLGLSLRDADQRITMLQQSVEGISLSVTDRNGTVSSVDLASGTLDLENLVFSVLQQSGATVIDGGNIKTGTISAVDIRGVRISGSEISGSVITSVSDLSQVKIDRGGVSFYDSSGDLSCGSLSYDGLGRLVLTSLSDAVLRIESSHNMALNAKNGKTIYIGADAGTAQQIVIGNSDSTIALNGSVTVNGTALF